MKPSSQYLLGEFLERREVKERLVLADVVLGVVRDVLARRLESVHLQVDPEIEVEVVDVDEVGEDQLAAARNSFLRRQHLARDHLKATTLAETGPVESRTKFQLLHRPTKSCPQ